MDAASIETLGTISNRMPNQAAGSTRLRPRPEFPHAEIVRTEKVSAAVAALPKDLRIVR
jgi:hypothetical protein